jgi:DUF1016 N-terminal domain
MRAFTKAWPDPRIVQNPPAQLPWGHITLLLDKLDDPATRDWYAAAADAGCWTGNVLGNQTMNRTRERFGAAPSNFAGSTGAISALGWSTRSRAGGSLEQRAEAGGCVVGPACSSRAGSRHDRVSTTVHGASVGARGYVAMHGDRVRRHRSGFVGCGGDP